MERDKETFVAEEDGVVFGTYHIDQICGSH